MTEDVTDVVITDDVMTEAVSEIDVVTEVEAVLVVDTTVVVDRTVIS